MAYSVQGNVITLTRGDTLDLTVEIFNGESPYTPASGDSIRFALKHDRRNVAGTDYEDTQPIITKTIDTSDMILHLDPTDTKSLGFGSYVYDIELTKADGTVDTFITANKFVIAPEVH